MAGRVKWQERFPNLSGAELWAGGTAQHSAALGPPARPPTCRPSSAGRQPRAGGTWCGASWSCGPTPPGPALAAAARSTPTASLSSVPPVGCVADNCTLLHSFVCLFVRSLFCDTISNCTRYPNHASCQAKAGKHLEVIMSEGTVLRGKLSSTLCTPFLTRHFLKPPQKISGAPPLPSPPPSLNIWDLSPTSVHVCLEAVS